MPRKIDSTRDGAGRSNVWRADRYGQHGWIVSLKRRGRRLRAYFSDQGVGGRAGALERALAWRDAMVSRLPPAVKAKRRHVRNTTGVIGVALEVIRDRGTGLPRRYYTASWMELTGKRKRIRFPLSRHGAREALRLAAKARREAMKRILSQKGTRPWWQSAMP